MSDLLLGICIGSALGVFFGIFGLATMQAFAKRDREIDALNNHYKSQGE